MLRGRIALAHLALDCLLCMGTALAYPALMFALSVSYRLLLGLCFVALYLPCGGASDYDVVRVCEIIWSNWCCRVCSCCTCKVCVFARR